MPLRYQEVKEEIRKTITGLKAGSKAPSRIFLSRKYEVARNTVDKAITELETEGYLYSVKGSGTYVTGKNVQKTLNVGVILPSITGDTYPQFISGIEQFASGNGINVVLSSSENFPDRQLANIQRMIEIEAAGCIIIPILNSQMSYGTFLQLKRENIPFVLCNRSIDGLDVPFIGTNNHYGAYIAAKHLIGQGCHRLAYISGRKYSTAIERYYGFETAVLDSARDVKKGKVILGNYGEDDLKVRIRSLLEEGEFPDGVLCFDDTTAAVLYTILQEQGLQPGRDVKVVGYNDSNICNILSVPLTSVSPEAKEMGKEAIAMLMGLIDGNGQETDFRLMSPRLVTRKSSCTAETAIRKEQEASS